jgi:hypothetical protein
MMPDRSEQAIPEWVSALDDLLGRYWALEHLVAGRDPEKTNVPPMQSFRWLVYTLNRLFAKNNCAVYGVDVTPEGYAVCAPPCSSEIGEAAAHVVFDWLKPAPSYPPFTTDHEQQELRDLSRRLIRACEDRLRAISEGGMAEPFLEFTNKERLLLLALHNNGDVPISQVLVAVWGNKRPSEAADALHKLKTRTNARLAARRYNCEIKRRGETLRLVRVDDAQPAFRRRK